MHGWIGGMVGVWVREALGEWVVNGVGGEWMGGGIGG